MTDQQIIDLYWSRSESAITETDRRYGSYCRTISRNILGSSEDAEECVNDTYLSAWNTMPPKRPNILRAFLAKITRNLSLNRLEAKNARKRGGGQTEILLSELGDCLASDDLAEEVEGRLITESIERFLAELPVSSRRLFIRRYFYCASIRELAKETGISESRLTARLYRLRNKLRLCLEKEGIRL